MSLVKHRVLFALGFSFYLFLNLCHSVGSVKCKRSNPAIKRNTIQFIGEGELVAGRGQLKAKSCALTSHFTVSVLDPVKISLSLHGIYVYLGVNINFLRS